MQRKTISVFGLGYVGCVSVACLANSGHKVIGVDTSLSKVDLINRGIATIIESNLDALLKKGLSARLIEATTDAKYAIEASDIVLITIGTPSTESGELDLSNIFSVAEAIGESLIQCDHFITVAIRSTVKPGTCRQIINIIEKKSNRKFGEHFSVVANPEFLREGTAILDYEDPPYVLIGAEDARGAGELKAIYSNILAEKLIISFDSAEVIKYVNNSWHALKVAFGNEIGSVCKSLRIDSHEVMKVFFRDRVLNISEYYMKPGYAYGGACLPKDLAALVALAKEGNVNTPLINSIELSNDSHIKRALELIKEHPANLRLGFLGISFKTGTDDLRNSPTIEIINQLVEGGYSVSVFDGNVQQSLSEKRNASLIQSLLGGVENLLVKTGDAFLEGVDVIVITKREKAFDAILSAANNRPIVDLVHIEGLMASKTLIVA